MSAAPSADYMSLVRLGPSEWRRTMVRGERPDVEALLGWEYRGTNLPATAALLGLRRFVKGFVDRDGRALGYNKSVPGADLDAPWTPRAQHDGRVAWAWFTVEPVDPEAIDNRYLHALLLDYGAVDRPEPGLAGRLRDYVVRVVPGSDELLLGQAFVALGRRRIAIGWFALERLGPSDQ